MEKSNDFAGMAAKRALRVGNALRVVWFFAYCGFLSVLEAEGLLPTRVSGSSAGALIAGSWASGLKIKQIEDLK